MVRLYFNTQWGVLLISDSKNTSCLRGDAQWLAWHCLHVQVSQLPETDELSWTRKQLLARLDVCMGGRAAEEMIFGEDNITSGASNDIEQATRLAHTMVTKYGMSDKVCRQWCSCVDVG